MKRIPPLHVAKAFYFFYYGSWACLSPFLALYYQSLGFSGAQIGVLASISPLTTLIIAPIWGGFADAYRAHKPVLLMAIAGAIVAVYFFSHARVYGLIAFLVALYAFFTCTIIPLVDNTVLGLLGERRDRYGVQRLWGAIGWGVAAPLIGLIINQYGLHWSFNGYLLLACFTFLAAWNLPVRVAPHPNPYFSGIRKLLADRRWFIFLAVAFLSGAGLSVTTNYLFLYMEGLHINRTVMGFSLTMATLSELPVLFFSGKMIKRWGPRGLLMVSLAAIVVRSYAYVISTQPWEVLAIQLLHGLTFSTMWVAGVSLAGEISPPGLGATAQGLFSSTVMGIGGISGALVGGLLYDRFGGPGMYLWSGSAVLFGLLLFALFARRLSVAEADRQPVL